MVTFKIFKFKFIKVKLNFCIFFIFTILLIFDISYNQQNKYKITVLKIWLNIFTDI